MASKTAYYICAIGLLIASFVLLPLVVLVPVSLNPSRVLEWPRSGLTLKWYIDLLQNPVWIRAFASSFVLGATVAILSTGIGAGIATRLVKCRWLPRVLAMSFFLSPLLVPVISLAVAIYVCLVRLRMTDTFVGLVGAHSVLCVPLSAALITAALARRQPFLEEAAINLGASKMQIWLLVTLPSLKNAVLACFLLSFAVSFNEVIVVLFLSDVNFVTVSREMWDGIRFEISPTLAAGSVLIVSIAIPVVVLFDVLVRRAFASGSE